MNLLKNNQALNRLLDRNPIHIFAFNYTVCYLIRPMPRAAIDYNHAVYWHNGCAYAIIELANPAKYRAKFISTK
jgi:hypothetical protein